MPKQTVPNNSNIKLSFQGLGNRRFEGDFDGGSITSDGGAVLLREIDRKFGVISKLCKCFTDNRDPDRTEHSIGQMLRQRIYGIAIGYEDLSDHDELRRDPFFATLMGGEDPSRALAGKSTLNRFELSMREDGGRDSRYHRIGVSFEAIASVILEQSLDQMSAAGAPDEIILDLDATDDPLHGGQEGRFFHGYYRHYCYLPLYVFAGDYLLGACLRPSDIDGAKGSLAELRRIVGAIRRRWPDKRIIVRADSGFCRDWLMRWCEAVPGVEYVIGLAKNARLKDRISGELGRMERDYCETGEACRCYTEFMYSTLKSWGGRQRRVIAKAEHLDKGSNPRFVVTSLDSDEIDPEPLYTDLYCARGDMENRIKEQQLCLFADRTSTHWMKTNQLRLWLSSVAYILMNALRTFALRGTSLARAMCDTIRLRLFKIGALVKVSVRRVLISMASGYPWKGIFEAAYSNLVRLRA